MKQFHPSSLDVGSVFHESAYGITINLTCLTKPVKKGDAWTWKARGEKGGEVDYLFAEHSPYNPNLFL